MTNPEKKVALVTGANKGIGFEIARQLAQLDITVLMGARDQDRGISACEHLRSSGLDAHFIPVDVTRVISLEAAIGRIRDDFRRLDILVNNAGIQIDTQSGIMKANGYGRIVNMASTLGSLTEIASPDSPHHAVLSPAYRLSKTLLNGITVLLAKELRGSNILVNSVCPGWVRTDMGGDEAPLTPEQGADTPVWLATLTDDGPTGGFFRERQPIPW